MACPRLIRSDTDARPRHEQPAAATTRPDHAKLALLVRAEERGGAGHLDVEPVHAAHQRLQVRPQRPDVDPLPLGRTQPHLPHPHIPRLIAPPQSILLPPHPAAAAAVETRAPSAADSAPAPRPPAMCSGACRPAPAPQLVPRRAGPARPPAYRPGPPGPSPSRQGPGPRPAGPARRGD